MRKQIICGAVLAALTGVSSLVSAKPPISNNPPATIPPGQVVPREPIGDQPRGQTVSTVAHATRDFRSLDSNRDGIIVRSELPAGHALVGSFGSFDNDLNASLSRAEFDAYVLRSAGVAPRTAPLSNDQGATIPPGQAVPRDPAGVSPRGQTVSTVAHANRDFKRLDANRDGMISRSELPAGHALIASFNVYDTNVNASLSRAEFDRYVLRSAGVSPSNRNKNKNK